jgi:hypothetical protein
MKMACKTDDFFFPVYERAKRSEVAKARKKYGTPLTLNITHMGGILPTKNFQYSTWEKALEKIDSIGVYKSITSHKACLSCFTPCSFETRISEGKYKGSVLEGPEYETLGMFGSNQLIDGALISHLAALSPGYDLVIPKTPDGWEPLHAIYSKKCLPFMEDLLRQNNLRILDLFSKVKRREVTAEEILPFDPHFASFLNIKPIIFNNAL